MIDLRSDTVTRPTLGMREAIANADVGDDALGRDPTAVALEQRVGALLGKEAALFFPSGIMANETALMLLTRPGTEVIVEATSHFVDWELGAPATWAGIQLRPVATPDGVLTAELVEAAIRPTAARLQIQTSAVCLENTHSASGGRVLPLERMREVLDVAHHNSLPVHLDGSRLWNASAESGIPEAAYAATADTVMVTLPKGLGCPVGSVLAGDAEAMDRARVIRRRLGGAMRQVGILAAAGLYALDHHHQRLADDHRRARRFAELARSVGGLRVIEPETNIVMLDITRPDLDSTTLIHALARRDVLLVEITRRRIRAVTHLDIDDADIENAADALKTVLSM